MKISKNSVAINNSIAPVGGDLYVLSEEEAVRTARYPEVVQVVLAPPPLARPAPRPAPALAGLRGLQGEVHRLAEVYQLQARLRPERQCKKYFRSLKIFSALTWMPACV